jgi:hypothetical protein
MDKHNYTAFDKFILRTPLIPYSIGKEEQLIDSALFSEAIFLASNDLLDSKKKYYDKKKDKKLSESYLKYFIRACTRCTPFGLFAGCSVGSISENSQIELVDSHFYTRQTRLDMQFLCELIKKIENIHDVQIQLLYYPNDSLYRIADKYRYIEYIDVNFLKRYQISSVQFEDYISLIIEKARYGANIYSLSKTLVDSDITYEEAENFVYELINSQLLKSELEPCTIGNDIFESLLEKLSKLENVLILDDLNVIKSLLEKINRTDIGDSIQYYHDIIKIINRLEINYNSKYLFQTDLFKPTKVATISSEIVNDINNVIQFLGRISIQKKNVDMETFKQKFMERYDGQEVPLQDIMDSELGIGYPVRSGHSVSPLVDDLILPSLTENFRNDIFSSIDQILIRKYTECLASGKDVIFLDNKDFERLNSEIEIPDTISVLCNIFNDKARSVYIKSISNYSSAACLLGRFCYINSSIKKMAKDICDKEAELRTNLILVEISHLPESRIGNIMSRPDLRNYTLHYLSNCNDMNDNNISVSDLLLSIKNGKLILRSKKYNKEIIPKLTCAYNYSLSTLPVFRFLCDFQNGDNPIFDMNLHWNNIFHNVDYLPRIQYKNVVLIRKRWIIRESDIADCRQIEDGKLLEKIKVILQNKKISQKVIIPDYDNELYVDFYIISHVKLFLSILIKRKTVLLEEFLFDEDHSIVKSGKSVFTNEFIFMFHK